jgi:LmbE family N-acetylglucosaminyl deacetylase
MSRRILVTLALVLLTLPTTARSRAVRHPGSAAELAPQSVLWIAAHPDDEAVAAPLLGRWCREQHARCGFLLMTRGQQGGCLRPDGCQPDVATVRAAEAGAASQLFGAELFLLQYQDGGGVQTPQWGATAGDAPDVVSRVADVIEAFHPTLILTFDPRHGTTCHPDHRETAAIVLDAVRLLPYTPDLYLLETRVTFAPDPFAIHFGSAVPGADHFDATQNWSDIVQDMQRHPSQFDEPFLTAIQQVPPGERAVWFGKAAEMLGRAATPCP